MNILAIDPGTAQSAYVLLDGYQVLQHGTLPNDELLKMLDEFSSLTTDLVVEMVQSFGMPVGAEVFETVWWIGRFCEAWKGHFDRIVRKEVCLHLCHTPRAKDPNVRQAVLDRYGGKSAIGKKKTPGPLYGLKGDEWQALGVGITYLETKQQRQSA